MGEAQGYRAPLHCVRHRINLAVVRRFVADGRPHDENAALDAIRRGECPACRPRYVAGYAEPVAGTSDLSALSLGAPCRCCGTRWTDEDPGWTAVSGQGLALERDRVLPRGREIASDRFVVDPLDPIRGPTEAVRAELLAFDALSGLPAADDLVEDLTESVMSAMAARADFDAELGRIASEHGLDSASADAWAETGGQVLATVQSLVGDSTRRGQCARCSNPAAGVHVSRAQFEHLVSEALDAIPDELASRMDNVAIVVRDRSGVAGLDHLLGLYQGVDLTRRQPYGGSAPDRITIFQETMSRHCDSLDELREQVRRTVIHEVAHHFGIGDPELRSLGW